MRRTAVPAQPREAIVTQDRIRPVILSGGAGTRLWPLSRRACPKQLLPLAGDRPMVAETAARVGDVARFHRPLLVAGADHGYEAARLVSRAARSDRPEPRPQPPEGLILEPSGRNTAPAIALAAHWVAQHDGAGALMLVMPSDHVIADAAAFRAAVETGAPLAADGWLVTFGIAADRPETGYGYIERGQSLAAGAFAVARFVEKPDRATALAYLASGRFDWNAGIFLMRADALLAALVAHAPGVAAAAEAAWALRRPGPCPDPAAAPQAAAVEPDPERWAACPAVAIDVAVMERHERVAVVPVAMGWSDVGGFDALADLGPADAAGNALSGAVVALDCTGSLIRAEPGAPLVAALGVEGLCVVATAGAVLVLPRARAQEVRRIVEELKQRGRADLL